ncbi:hypothetical protein GCM10023169_10840 [Georgenia halophila]|uniref:Uncharacterized protein n=1 Tax=Georgenia halophila TaxID=620889 RepID=A0ABP8L0M3_9MICO
MSQVRHAATNVSCNRSPAPASSGRSATQAQQLGMVLILLGSNRSGINPGTLQTSGPQGRVRPDRRRNGYCARPIRLTGSSTTVVVDHDARGLVLAAPGSAPTPSGPLIRFMW